MAMYGGFELHSGNAALDYLLSRGGMASMLPTVWLIMSAMMFGGVMETTGMLRKIGQTILGFVTGTGSLIAATLVTAIGFNIIASDQYMAIVLPGRMFRAEYQKRRLDPKNLSRTLEDAGTLTSVLVPWNTCGAFIAQTLGVATLTYAPYCFFNLLSPMVAALYGFTNFTIRQAPRVVLRGRIGRRLRRDLLGIRDWDLRLVARCRPARGCAMPSSAPIRTSLTREIKAT